VISSSDLTLGGLTGRAAETAAIRRALSQSRLVTVTGLPGVGKTATCIAAAMSAGGRYRDGVTLIRLDALTDEALLPHSIAAAMLLPDTFDASPLTTLTDQLRARQVLIVLDTCEHLLGACAALASAIGEICPDVRILATSREPLRVPGEEVLTLLPLSQRDSVRLFNQHAAAWGAALARKDAGLSERTDPGKQRTEPGTQRTDPGKRSTDAGKRSTDLGEQSTVQAICGRLDGLPLAIGMAARQLATGSLDALLAGLEGGYDFLSDPAAPVARHRTLQAAIGWSHQLCTPAERLLWARLAVFDGSFSIKDCQEVCATTHLADETIAVGVTMLADRSLLLRAPDSPDNGSQACFMMPSTIRAYGLAMLRRLAEDEEMRRRYRNWRSGPRRDACWH
jgi:predicted ATPase